MVDASTRALRGAVAVCRGVGLVAATANAGDGAKRETTAHAEPLRLHREGNPRATTFAYAPRDASVPKPAVVYLNGRCGVTTNGCPHFKEGAEAFGWLVCPPANVACPGGGASWGGAPEERRAVVEEAVSDVARAYPGKVDASAPTVLIGFSQGAWIALDLARQKPGTYAGILLIGADVAPRPSELRAAGVARNVLAAGSFDQAAPAMSQQAKALAAAGIDARFVSLGKVGHTYVAEREGILTEQLTWLEEAAATSAAIARTAAL